MSVGEIFADAQRSVVGHKGLAKRLRRLEEAPGFEAQIKQCVYRLLDVAKSEVAGNRVVKFLTTYLETADASSATASTILLTLLPFVCAKDKTVRYRATQIVSQTLGVLTSIDDDLYTVVRQQLIRRLHDKVPAIRLEAVLALGRLVENEMDEEQQGHDSDEEITPSLLETLLDVLQNDSNADIRRALLLNLPVTPTTLPYLLERARDRDAPTRRALYSKLLPSLGDFRHLSVSMREKLIRWGLRDRDEKVRKAAAKLFCERWIEDCAGSRIQTEGEGEGDDIKKTLHEPSLPALLELLERIDIINSGNETGIASEAMKELWLARPDYLQAINFDDDYWTNLTPESAFVVRTFNEHCQTGSDYQGLLEEKLPEVTRLGFYLQKQINVVIERIALVDDGQSSEEEIAEQEFILEQLLHVAHTLDYTDEMGRRKMFSLLRNALAIADLPDESSRLTVDALRIVCTPDAAGEREFTSVVLEAIAEVHDTITGPDADGAAEDDSFVSARSEVSEASATSQNSSSTVRGATNQSRSSNKKSNLTPEEEEAQAIREIIVNLKCLHLAQCMLQNVTTPITSNIHLETMLNNLVIPAVRSRELPLRERGLLCLGLCCLLEPNLADDNRSLFVHCLAKGDEALQTMSLKILCDILLTHKSSSITTGSVPTIDSSAEQPTVVPIEHLLPFVKAFGYESPEVQSTSTTSLGKLMLCGFYKGNEPAFEEATDRAVLKNAKGWELLGKVRDVVRAQNPPAQKEGVDQTQVEAGQTVVGGGVEQSVLGESSGHGSGNNTMVLTTGMTKKRASARRSD